MSEFYLDFVFIKIGNTPFTEDECINIRRQVCTMMNAANFGTISENNGHFANEYAIPLEDNPQELNPHILTMTYAFIFPLAHGDLTFIFQNGLTRLGEIGRQNNVIVNFHCSCDDL